EEFAVRQAQNTVVVLHGGNLFPTAEHVAVANYVLTGDLRYLNQIPEQTGPWGPGILVDVFTALGYEYRSWQGQVWGQIGPVVAGAGVIFTPGQERDYPSGNVPAGERLEYTETPWDAAARQGYRWQPGDPINAPTRSGDYPSWSTVRRRYWINEALNNPSSYSEENLARMRRGLAPLDKTGASMHLHHINGRDIPDPHNWANLMIVSPREHYQIHHGGR
ncbi:MAG: HNH/ENDO VII family nuclease, partial [Anaerolineae bacterium]|nr:HNH/ENDO VII family nuclease [Anaerolineae bacterium]